MSRLPKFALLPMLGMSVVLFAVGCPQKQDAAAAGTAQAATQDQAPDPAAVNLAPATDSSTAAPVQAAPTAPVAQQQAAPPPDNSGASDQGPASDDPGYGAQPVAYAPQAPPPLPEYEQPEAPGDGYLWTPGYWAYGQMGYYWVPGGWVEAPYQGALWTPGYWGYRNNRYGFYGGYWGLHIGYYGGVDYGFGYMGFGYQGGYWGGGHFNYNRSVNNVNISVMRNVYSRSISGGGRGGVRVSFTGGSGGLQIRARPAELAARRETHAQPMMAQVQNQRAASTNRAQFASVNHGRPASMAVARPLAADRNVRTPATVQVHNQPQGQQQRQMQLQQQRQAAPQRQAQQQQQRQAAPQRQQQQRQAAPQRQQQQRQAAPQRQQQQQQHQATQPHQTAEKPRK